MKNSIIKIPLDTIVYGKYKGKIVHWQNDYSQFLL